MQNTAKLTLPTETVELPSKGLLYSKDNPLSAGTIEMKYMTAKEEDILTNPNLLKQGLAIEKVLRSLIKSPINFDFEAIESVKKSYMNFIMIFDINENIDDKIILDDTNHNDTDDDDSNNDETEWINLDI